MMGNVNFGLQKRPFVAEPVPESYCPFGSMESARTQISRCIERQEGAALVTGLSGTGKTLLCRTIQKQFQGKLETVLLNGKNLRRPQDFFETILGRLGLDFEGESLTAMRDFLIRQLQTSARFRSGLLILLDDAQAAAIRVFEEIRQLLDLTAAPGMGVRVVLSGNTSLEEKLDFKQLHDFSQRITTRCFLEAFNRDETTAFLKEELAQAGDEIGLFSKEVCRTIHKFTDGVPRLINQLADHVLVLAREEAKAALQQAEEEAEPTENGILSSIDSDSALDPEQFAGWDSDSFIENEKSEVLASDVSAVPTLTEKLNEKEAMLKEKVRFTSSSVPQNALTHDGTDGLVSSENEAIRLTPEMITPDLVNRAWRKLQQFADSTEDDLNDGSVFSTGETALQVRTFGSDKESAHSISGTHSTAGTSSAKGGNPVEFGSLDDEFDDDFDSVHSIDFDSSSAEDSTQVWSYDEAQEVRAAVEQANAFPEEWTDSANENAILNEKTEADLKSIVRAENSVGTSFEELKEQIEKRCGEIQKSTLNSSENAHSETFSDDSALEKNDDLWDIFRETANIQFPNRKNAESPLPSYSSSQPGILPNSISSKMNSEVPPISESQESQAYTSRTQASSAPFAVQQSSNPLDSRQFNVPSIQAQPFAPFTNAHSAPLAGTDKSRSMSVEELILDAVMQDTVHSMSLLQNILCAMREETASSSSSPQPGNYWLNLQNLVKDSIQQIAQDRLNGTFRKSAEIRENQTMTGFSGANFDLNFRNECPEIHSQSSRGIGTVFANSGTFSARNAEKPSIPAETSSLSEWARSQTNSNLRASILPNGSGIPSTQSGSQFAAPSVAGAMASPVNPAAAQTPAPSGTHSAFQMNGMNGRSESVSADLLRDLETLNALNRLNTLGAFGHSNDSNAGIARPSAALNGLNGIQTKGPYPENQAHAGQGTSNPLTASNGLEGLSGLGNSNGSERLPFVAELSRLNELKTLTELAGLSDSTRAALAAQWLAALQTASVDSQRKSPQETSDFYRPESLLEEGTLLRNPISKNASVHSMLNLQPQPERVSVPNSFSGSMLENLSSAGSMTASQALAVLELGAEAFLNSDEFSQEESEFSEISSEDQISEKKDAFTEKSELNLLRSQLQKIQAQDGLTDEMYKRLQQIISRLQTLEQPSKNLS